MLFEMTAEIKGGFNEDPQLMFWIKNKKNGLSLYTKMGYMGYSLHGHGL